MSFMRPIDWAVVGGGALLLIAFYSCAFALEAREDARCAGRGGVRVHTACLRKDVVLP